NANQGSARSWWRVKTLSGERQGLGAHREENAETNFRVALVGSTSSIGGASPIFRFDARSRRGLEREPAQNGLLRLRVYAHRQWGGARGFYGKAAVIM